MLIAAAAICMILAVFYIAFFVVFPIGRGAVFFPSSRSHTLRMVEMAEVSAGERAADLGSGDGRVVIALARRGAEAHGYEINPALVLLSLWNIRRAGCARNARIHWQSFWRADLSSFRAITVFQGGFIMRRLEKKVLRELPVGARVVSDYWRFPTLAPSFVAGTLHLYRMGARKNSAGLPLMA